MAITNMMFLFEHYFPKVDVTKDSKGSYTNNETALIFSGFSLAWETLQDEDTRNKIAINCKQKLVEKLEGDIVDLKRKLDVVESKPDDEPDHGVAR